MADEKPKLPPGVPPPEYVALDPTLANYMLRNISSYDWGKLLAPWVGPLPGDGSIITASVIGDLFVRGPDRRIYWLEAPAARVTVVARHNIEFDNRMGFEHPAFFKTPLIDQLIRAERFLQNGQIYGLMKPPAEGGRYHPDNVGITDVVGAFTYWGSLFNAAANAPLFAASDAAFPVSGSQSSARPASASPAPAVKAESKVAEPPKQPDPPKTSDDKKKPDDKPKKKGWF